MIYQEVPPHKHAAKAISRVLNTPRVLNYSLFNTTKQSTVPE